MALTLEQLRANFAAANNKGSFQGADKFYAFWKMAPSVDDPAIIRFLPDGNEENNLGFVQENRYHKLMVNGKQRRVPCLYKHPHNTTGEACPLCDVSIRYYDAGDNINGKKYYKSSEHFANIIVRKSPFEYDGVGKIKLISLGPKLYKQILSVFQSGDLDVAPYDYDNGYDYRIVKQIQGENANYDTSSFARKPSSLSEAELKTIEEAGLPRLVDECTPYVSRQQLLEWLNADLQMNGQPTTPGFESLNHTAIQSTPVQPAMTTQVPNSTPVASAPVSPASSGGARRTAADILADIRAGRS